MEEYAQSPKKILKKYLPKILIILIIFATDIYFYDSFYNQTLWINQNLQSKQDYLKPPALFFNLIFSPVNIIAMLLLVMTFRRNKLRDINLICSTAFVIYICQIFNMIFHKERPYWNKANNIEGMVCASGFGYPSEHIIIFLFASYNFVNTNYKKQFSQKKIIKHSVIALLIIFNAANAVSRLIVGVESLNQVLSGFIWGYCFIYIYLTWLNNYLSKLLEKFCNTVDQFYKNYIFWISLGIFSFLIFFPISFYIPFHMYIKLSDKNLERIQNSCSSTLILSSTPLDNEMLKSSIITAIFGSFLACFGSYTCNLTVIQRREDVKMKKKFMKILVKIAIFLCLIGLFYIPFKYIVFDNIYVLYLFKYCLIYGIVFYVAIRVYPLLLIQFQIHDEEDLELFFGKTEGITNLNDEKNEENNEQEQEGLTSKIVEYYALSDGN